MTKLTYGSVCSGVEAATLAWRPLGWECKFVSEIEPFPCAVLKERFPDVVNFGDMTRYKEWKINGAVNLLVGGTPCQSFSVAGPPASPFSCRRWSDGRLQKPIKF